VEPAPRLCPETGHVHADSLALIVGGQGMCGDVWVPRLVWGLGLREPGRAAVGFGMRWLNGLRG